MSTSSQTGPPATAVCATWCTDHQAVSDVDYCHHSTRVGDFYIDMIGPGGNDDTAPGIFFHRVGEGFPAASLNREQMFAKLAELTSVATDAAILAETFAHAIAGIEREAGR